MTEGILPIVLLIMTAAGIAGGILVATHGVDALRRSGSKIGRWFGPSAKVDLTPYECGMKPYGRVARHRYSIHFYLVAMLFILFDIEAAFLFPWAVTFRDFAANRLFVLGEMGVFLGILIVGFIYVWKLGALEWE